MKSIACESTVKMLGIASQNGQIHDMDCNKSTQKVR